MTVLAVALIVLAIVAVGAGFALLLPFLLPVVLIVGGFCVFVVGGVIYGDASASRVKRGSRR